MDFNVSIYLDKRRPVKHSENLYPVKLRAYSKLTRKTKLYSTDINLSPADYDLLFNSNSKVKGEKREFQLYLYAFEKRAYEAAATLSPFTFDAFEKKLFRSKNASISVVHHYHQKIKTLRKNNQVATASNYDLSLKSIGSFILNKVDFKSLEEKERLIGEATKTLTFYDITQNWLNSYESFMIKTCNKSFTTVSIYLRCLRTIFNDAINDNEIKQDIYPFGRGKGKYQIPISKKKKKALSKEQLALLFHATPQTPEQEKAKDFWFLSYALYGMNFKDIALLRSENIKEDYIRYYREKTISTKRNNLKEITVYLNSYSKTVIKKYENLYHSENDLVFPIVNKNDDAFQQKRKIKNFISFVNLHFNKLAKSIGFDFKISTYWARHSFATISIQKGASMEFISEALSHSNLNVTKNYFAGFEDETKKEFANNLMDF